MTITLTREEAQQVLDALEEVNSKGYQSCWKGAFNPEIKLLRDRLAHPEPEPVAWYWSRGVEFTIAFEEMDGHAPLYLHPPQREWQGLTDEEVHNTVEYVEDRALFRFARAIEAKLKEKNGG